MKQLLLLLILITGVNAEQFVFTVENATMVDAYWNIFNSMAALFQNQSYNSLLQLAFLVGGFGVFFAGVLKGMGGGNGQGGIMDFTKYMVVGMSLLTLVYSHTSELVIKTDNIPSFCSMTLASNESIVTTSPTTGTVVANIPTMLAWSFSGLNTIGVETTKLAKLAFGPIGGAVVDPGARSGFATYLEGIGAITSLTLDSVTADAGLTVGTPGMATIGATLIAINNDCILLPAAQDTVFGPQIISTMKQTGNLKETIEGLIVDESIDLYKNPTIVAPDTLATGVTINGIAPRNLLVSVNGEMLSCGEAWTRLKQKLLDLKASKSLECQSSLKDVIDPTTIAVLTGTTGTVAHAQDIALNAAMANEVFDSKRNIAMGSELSFAAGKSMSEFTNSSIGSGYYMAQMLPYLQMGIRAVLYAFFPFIFVVILLPGGIKVLISYLQSLVWVELWSPTAAILDMFLSLVANDKFQSMYNDKGFNPTNSAQTFSDAAMLASVGGYLYASVPALTYLILKGSAQMLGNITGGVASGFSRNIDSATINRDIGSLKKLGAVNEGRKSRGEEMVSLAEMDSMAATHMALSSAGTWESNEQNKGAIKAAASGSNTATLIAGVSNNKLFNQKDSKANINAKIADNVIAGTTNTKTQQLTGTVDSSGNIVAPAVEAVSDSAATANAVKVKTEMKGQEIEKKVLGASTNQDLVDDKSEVKSLVVGTQTEKEKTEQDKILEIAQLKDPNANKIDANLNASKVVATKNSLEVVKTGAELGLKAGGDPTDPKNLGKLVDNTVNIANATTSQSIGAGLGVRATGTDAAIDSSKQTTIAMVGKGEVTGDKLKETMKMLTEQGSKEAAAFEASIAGHSEDKKIEERAAWLETGPGIRAAQAAKISGDSKAVTLVNGGMNSADTGSLEGNTILANRNSKNDWAKEAYAAGGAAARAMNGAIKHLYGPKATNANISPEQRAAAATEAQGVLVNTAQVYNSEKDKALVTKLRADNMGPNRAANADAFAKETSINMQEIYGKYVSPETLAGSKVFKELVGLGYTGKRLTEDMYKLMGKPGSGFNDPKQGGAPGGTPGGGKDQKQKITNTRGTQPSGIKKMVNWFTGGK